MINKLLSQAKILLLSFFLLTNLASKCLDINDTLRSTPGDKSISISEAEKFSRVPTGPAMHSSKMMLAGENLILNPEFDQGTTNWNLVDYTSPAGSSISVAQGEGLSGTNALRVDVVNTDNSGWMLQLEQVLTFRLEVGKTYRISFMAKAESTRALNVSLFGNGNNYNYFYTYTPLSLTTTPQTFSFDYTCTDANVNSEPNFSLKFYLASGVVSDVWLDKVNVADITGLTPVTGVSIDPTSLTLTTGQTGQLTPTITPSNATNQNVTWTTANAGIATVNASGLVTAVASGTTTITATTVNGGFTATSSVTVQNNSSANQILNPEFDQGTTNWVLGDWTGAGYTNGGSSFSSVTGANMSGTNALYVNVVNANNESWTLQPYQTLNFRLDVGRTYEISFMAKGETSRAISAALRGLTSNTDYWTTNATLSTTSQTFGPFQFVCTNNQVAGESSFSIAFFLAKGVISDVWIDNVIVKDITPGGSPIRFEAESYNAMSGVTNTDGIVGSTDGGDWVRYDNINLGTGFTTFTTRYAKDVTSGTTMEIRSGNPTSGTLLGTLTTAATGGWGTFTTASTTLTGASGIQTIYIAFPTGAGNGNFDWFEFNNSSGTIAVSGVTVSPSSVTLTTGQTSQLTNTITPSNATNQNVTWSSSNTGIATVNSSGLVTAVAAGSATITATSVSNPTITGTSSITVSGAALTPLIGLRFNETSGAPLNTGTLSGTFTRSATTPAISTNVSTSGGDRSLDFGATTGNYYVESSGVLDGLKNLSSFTITGWLNLRNNTIGSGGNRIVSWINNGGDGVDLVYLSNGSLQVGIDQWPDGSPAVSTAAKVTFDAGVAASNWVFFAMSYQSSNSEVKFYFGNNTADAVLDVTRTYNRGVVGTNTGKLAIGHFNDATRAAAQDRMLRGLVDEIQIHGAVLSLSDIVGVQRNTGSIIAVTGVSVAPSTATINPGQTSQLTATVSPANASNQNVTWSSNNTSVATVNSSGLVTGVAAGSATITATTADGGFTSTSAVTIQNIAVTGVSVSPTASTLTLGGTTTVQLTASITPANATNQNVTWSSSNTSIATVNSSGLVTAVAAGSATITATAVSNPTITGTSSITVSGAALTPLIGLRFNETSGAPLNTGTLSGTFTRSATTPAISTNVSTSGGDRSLDFGTTTGNYYVESSTVLDGLKNLSSFTITGWLNLRNNTIGSGGNRIVSWINNGGDGVDLVYLGNGSLQVGIDQWPDGSPAVSTAGKVTFDAGVAASNWVFFAMSYQSGNSEVKFYFGNNTADAVLDVTRTYNRGVVGTNTGKLAIGHFNDATRAAAQDRMLRGLVDEIQIHGAVLSLSDIVGIQRNTGSIIAVTGVSVAPSSATINPGQTSQLTATVSPANASNQNVTWSSNNTSVATVNSSGLVTGVAAGSATITATTADGGFTSTSAITVQNVAVTGVSVTPATVTITQSLTSQLTTTITPVNATNQNVTWSSSNASIATVNSSGLVTAVAVGSATITATSVSNPGVSGSSAVTVQAGNIPVAGVTLLSTSLNIAIGQTSQLTQTISPSNATNQAVTWASNNTSVATVNSSGLVTAVANGLATITVTTAQGGFTATSLVQVGGVAVNIPNALRASPQLKPSLPLVERGPFALASLSVGSIQQVFQAPPCLTGSYYAGFQLSYDLGNTQTEQDWSADLAITLLNNTTVVWTKTLSVRMTDQTFISTVFHDVLLTCDPNYQIRIDAKNVNGTAPQSNIYLKFLLYKNLDDVFSPTATASLNCTNVQEKSTISWTYAGLAAVAYDLEWVFIANHENFTGTTSQEAFQFKEPVRVTTTTLSYTHSTYYPTGKIAYRVRAIGYNSAFPEHRILGNWFYGPCGLITINNHQPNINWQEQTIFAEEGKHKKIMNYFDGSLRQRQSQTNLSTSGDTTLVGETLYDYEGRQAVDILAVPAASVSLKYKPSFNPLAAQQATVTSKTSARRKKFHYDNDVLENSIIANTDGAGRYYSPANTLNAFRKDYIPDAEGYVFSQTEYVNDGTGRVKRQSGVGKEFRMDGSGRPTKSYYGNAAPSELIRLFGTNVGNANHYKKNMMVDPNGQANVSYLDQEGRVVATALSGTSPENVNPLDSYTSLPTDQLLVNISSKNVKRDGASVNSHKILNSVPNTTYTFAYNFSALGADLQTIGLGCVTCAYDLKITITDPDGRLVTLPTIAGNEAADNFSYERKNITAASCATPTLGVGIQFGVNFVQPGDYTVSKVITPTELNFEQAKTIVSQSAFVQAKIQEIENAYTVDASNCEICTDVPTCDEAETAINDAINEIADRDCENMYQLIVQALKDDNPNNYEYEPTEAEIAADPNYCEYQLCLASKSGDIFEKQISRVATWTEAVTKGYDDLSNVGTNPYPDPFFRAGGLGAAYTGSLQAKLDNVYIGTVAFDSNGDGIENGTTDYIGTILQVIDPLNTTFYIDQNGNQTTSTTDGNHILYYDLMSRRKAGQISETVYQNELIKQRWTFFKSFYIEAKRKTKLEITEVQNCPVAKTKLEAPDLLPRTQEEIRDFGNANGATVPVSDEEVEAIYSSLVFTCANKTISSADQTTIKTELKSYFDEKPNGLFRFILISDVGVNPHLNAIQAILNTYGCVSLLTIAVEDPLSCLNDTTITYKNKFVVQAAHIGMGQMSMQIGAEQRDQPARINKTLTSLNLDKSILSKSDKEIIDAIKQDIFARPKEQIPESSVSKSKISSNSNVQTGFQALLVIPDPSPEEYNALVEFYNATSIPGPNYLGWTNSTGWGTSSPVSEWYGVTVDQTTGHVIGIDLGNNNIRGTIPYSFRNLIHLEVLHLQNNSVYYAASLNPLPEMVNLKDLDLSNTSYFLRQTAPFTWDLSVISTLVNLEILKCSECLLEGEIPTFLSNLSNLKELRLDGNRFTGSLPSFLGNLINLKVLNLSHNDLTGNLPTSWGNLTQLEILHLYNVGSLSVGQTRSIPPSFGNLISLKELNLRGSKVTGDIPSQLGNLVNLKVLDLSYNNLVNGIPSQLGSLINLETLDLSDNPSLGGIIPPQLTALTNLLKLTLYNCSLSGIIPENIGNLQKIIAIELGNNNLEGGIPPSIGSCLDLLALLVGHNNLSGPIPPELGLPTQQIALDLRHNGFSGQLPASLNNLDRLAILWANDNQFTGLPATLDLNDVLLVHLFNNEIEGSLTNRLGDMPHLNDFQIQNNKLSGSVYDFIKGSSQLFQVKIDSNRFTFNDFIELKPLILGQFTYTYQDSVDVRKLVPVVLGSPVTLTTSIDRTTTPPSSYQWFQFVDGTTNDIPLNTYSASGHTITLPSITSGDLGKKYYYKITNSAATDLVLTSRLQTLALNDSTKSFVLCKEFDQNNTTLQLWSFQINWSQLVQQCMDSAAVERDMLVQYAIDRLIQDEASAFYSQHKTNCLNNTTETLTYSYVPKEYHYTLYYYDQAGNLEQTVPPQGVKPLTPAQVTSFLAGTPVDPLHTFVTRYQYNSLNQSIYQKTPDAGESRFYYNDKGELRLSQNAQQLNDGNYSYTKYDQQGRIVEVGEMNTTTSLGTLLTQLEDVAFPAPASFTLSDITRTYYDLPNVTMQPTFPQDNLRTRVAWVEVLEKNAPDIIATYYSYDIHGNVKSLLQQVPGLANKRTDYIYELVSGNVNYVLYQYDQPDQFVHRYKYDADNRLKEVATSTDGYLWDTEATYRYYLHGPLARVELGQYRVQGLDYYYTLQGWVKGVNMPFAADPGNDGYAGVNLRVGRDVFSYTLGYYENDYKPRNAARIISDSRDQLWSRFKTMMGASNTGLYNGNISWMVTDLKKIGQQKGARVKGMQAMLYKYDQLNRIVQSRSLTTYAGATGFATRTASPAAYDEDFSYDANGNILTLKRRDNVAALQDDFTYTYYTNTNKLRYHIPIVRDTVYSGAIITNNKVYRRITVQGTAFAPANENAVIRAIENIDIDEGFDVQTNATFRAYVLPDDEGAYNYDAIGNLIWDQDKGIRITWTPYGKVRQVTKNDGTTVTFRYDGAGNRIEKKVVKTGPTPSITITRYIRDASGNVMGVYDGSTLTEQSIYGSNRLGLYNGGRTKGQRKLGHKRYELSNHLGNVLSVITDNIHMTTDSTWATVASASDYYAFGSSMADRNFDDDTYRYGFNGKEKDDKGELGDTHYDYGFRIYNPKLGRFLSVDPLTKTYPWYTPYQFAGNTPIMAVDVDGLEDQVAIDGSLMSGPFNMEKINTEIVRQRVNTVKRSMNQQPISRSPNTPTIGLAPQELESVRKARLNTSTFNKAVADGQRKGEAIYPFHYGGPGFGTGMNRSLVEGFKQLPGIVLPELALAKISQLRYFHSLTKVQQGIVTETNTILKSAELEKLRTAHEAGKAIEVSVGGRTILYEPTLNSSGLSLFGENGFVLGKEAFKTEAELTKTVLHELQRLNTSTSQAAGVSAELAASETKGAFDFAEKTYNALYK